MTVIQNVQNYRDDDRNRPDYFGYDLDEEKKRIAEATEEIKKELWGKWQKRYAGAQIFPTILENINPNLVDFLLSFNNTLFYDDLTKKFGLNQGQRDILPQIIWQIAINKNWDESRNLISTKLNLNPTISSQFIQLLDQNILFEAKKLSESQFVSRKKIGPEVKTEGGKISISIAQAVGQYHNLGEQLITSSPIKLKIFPSPVRPSIKNWIEDYRQTMGAQKHGMMERGNYLFHSNNTKTLTPGERKRLAEILRSLDEDVTLSIDSDRQEVVFEQVEETRPTERISNDRFPMPNHFQNSNDKGFNFPQSAQYQKSPSSFPDRQFPKPQNKMQFFSPQIMSSEKKTEPMESLNKVPAANRPWNNPSAGKPWPGDEKNNSNNPRIKGNVVDLKN